MKSNVKVIFVNDTQDKSITVKQLKNGDFGRIVFVPEGCYESFKIGDLVVKLNDAILDLNTNQWTTFGHDYGNIRVNIVESVEIRVTE